MGRRTDVRRGSIPEPQELCSDPDQKALLEARNGLLQFDRVLQLIDEAAVGDFRLRPSTIQELNRIAIQDKHNGAGVYRNGQVYIQGTSHQPPPPEPVPRLVEEMCDYVNNNWTRSPVHLASFIMWRLNWIHPFWEGNGRSSRAASYLVLCARLGYRLPGDLTVPEQADSAWQKSVVDVSRMEDLMDAMLAKQLAEVLQEARQSSDGTQPSR